jgi:hypothetical protein
VSTPGDRRGDMVIRRRLGNAAAFASAANWADPAFAIPGWRVLSSGESPQPGDVVGQRIQWPNGATGHVMIVGPNANFIGVGESEKIESVAAKMMGKDKPGGLLVYRRYEP